MAFTLAHVWARHDLLTEVDQGRSAVEAQWELAVLTAWTTWQADTKRRSGAIAMGQKRWYAANGGFSTLLSSAPSYPMVFFLRLCCRCMPAHVVGVDVADVER